MNSSFSTFSVFTVSSCAVRKQVIVADPHTIIENSEIREALAEIRRKETRWEKASGLKWMKASTAASITRRELTNFKLQHALIRCAMTHSYI